MIPNYNSGLLQQQQQQQLLHQNQQQGQQQPQQQTLQQQQQQDQHLNPSNMEQPRLHWGQMQPFRQQNPSADLNHQKTTQAHLAEFMKRTQQQQSSSPFVRSQPQAHQGFPMGLGMPQQNNGAPVLGGNPQQQQQQQQQQPFHDQHPQQAHLPQGFTNMGVVPNGSVAASMPARNPPAVLQNPQAARQLEMINMAQQSQNALNKFPQPQQQQQQQHSPPQQQQLNQMRDQQQQQAQQQQAQFQQGLNQSDMFASPVMSAEGLRRPSPHPINNPSMQQNPGVGPGAQPPSQGAGSRGPVMTMNELQSRVNAIRTGIQALGTVYDSLAQQMSTIRGNPAAESQLNQKMKETQAEIAKRKDYMNRMVMMWRQQNLGGGNGGQPANPWMHHPNLGQPFDPSNGQTPRQQMGLLPGQPSHLMQTSPNLPHVQAQNPVANSGMVNPRPGQAAPQPPPAPSQSLPHHAGVASPFTNGMGGANAQFPKPNMQPQQLSQAQHPQPPQQPQQLQNGPGSGPSQQQTMSGVQGGNPLAGPSAPPLALDKAQFERYLTVYCSKRGIKIDPRVLGMENRPLDLHALHIQVLQEGGFAKVEGNDNLWCIIGGRLGFVQFPGTATEPAKAGPGVAQSLQHIYKEFIAPFEVWYLGHVQDFRKQQYVHMYSTLQSQLASIGSPYTLQQIAQLSILSVADLRSQGFDDKIIQIIENGKPMLQRIVQEQRSFADGVRSNNASQNMGQGMDQNGATGARQLGMGPTPPFGGSAAQQQQQQQQQNALNRQHQAALQQQMLHQQSQQQAGHHLQSQLPEGVDNILGVTRMPQQQPGPMQAQGQMAGSALQNAQKQQVARAVMLIEQFKNEFIISNVANANFDVPIEQQVEYSQILEQVYHKSNDMERKVAPLALLSKDENIVRRAVNIMCTINQQKVNMSSASGPRYIVNLEALRAMANDLNRIHEIFMTFQTIKMQHQQQQLQKQQQQQHLQQSQMMNNMMAPPIINKPDLPQSQIRPVMPQNRPPSVVPPAQPQLSSQQQVPPNLNQTLRPPPTVQPTSKRKGPQTPGSVAVSSPSPSHVASAPTPVANTPTPTATASSPPAATKSPKAKAPPKKATAPKTRRTSKVVTPVVPPAAPEPAQTSTASPPTTSGGKRPREEEEPTPNNNNGGNTNPAESSEVATESSPPKRIKTEWEAQPTEAQRKKQENIANLKTDEEVIDLMGQMTELIKFAAGAEEQGQSVSLTTGISETLEMLLKGYGPIPDSIEGYGGTSVCGEPSGSRELETGPGPLADAFDEFIDFSYVTAEDEDSKTPDLISSSSTNPSPESNHEAEAGHHLLTSSTSALDIKVEDSSDLLRLGTWKEIDGGESAYYQTTEWKYDSPMTSLDQPWAIFNP